MDGESGEASTLAKWLPLYFRLLVTQANGNGNPSCESQMLLHIENRGGLMPFAGWTVTSLADRIRR